MIQRAEQFSFFYKYHKNFTEFFKNIIFRFILKSPA